MGVKVWPVTPTNPIVLVLAMLAGCGASRAALAVASDAALPKTALAGGDQNNADLPDAAVVAPAPPDEPLPGGPTSPCFTRVAAGAAHTCGLRTDGTVLCWGGNPGGRLGVGAANGAASVVLPTIVAGVRGTPVDIAAGGSHTCARTMNGELWCWGDNGMGQVGDGTSGNTRPAPTLVFAVGASVTSVATGAQFTCVVRTDRAVWCWGDNSNFQLALSARVPRPRPGPIGFSPGAPATTVEIAAGAAHTCSRNAAGAILCWGANRDGQLGDSTRSSSFAPVAVLGLSAPAAHLALGEDHSCTSTADGSALCWGANDQGQLGDGTAETRTIPVPVRGLTAVVELAAGATHTCARRSDETVWCWGGNHHGQLGDATSGTRATPAIVPGLGGVVQLAAGGNHTCARTKDGALWCWGEGLQGQLGDGTTTPAALRPIPVRAACP